ncbi:hypothetical protein B5S31_g304 [[Candida] boidinii]|nr:hypothetical protein B5S31_g304 [[Candida] boidinii]GME68859.1 unnamed protein product [[Candida] boidinii]
MFRQSIRSFSSTARTNMAKMQLIGTIGSDLTKQTTSSGKPFLKYSIAVNSKSKGEQVASWYNIAVFNEGQINYMESYLGKGAKIFVEADVQNSSYEKQDGSRGYSLMLFQNSFETLRYPKREGEEGEEANA